MKSAWVVAVVVGIAVVSACSHTAPPPKIDHVKGADEVLIQVGDYMLGQNIDGFVWAPQLIVYGDGSVYAETANGLMTGSLTESQVQRLLRDGAAVPSDAPVGTVAVDASPLLVISGTHFWEIGDLRVQPLMGYVEEIHSVVSAAATQRWTPTRWILRPYDGPCTVVADEPDSPDYYDAPVYPHLLDEYPLGECPPAG